MQYAFCNVNMGHKLVNYSYYLSSPVVSMTGNHLGRIELLIIKISF